MHRKSRPGEDFSGVASISPSFTTVAYDARQVVPIYFPGPVERVAIWFNRTRLRQNIQILLLVIIFGIAGGITGGILAAVNRDSAQNDPISIVAEETTQDIEPPLDRIIQVQAPPRLRRHSFTRPRPRARLIAAYELADFKAGKRNDLKEDGDN
jgi:hypothetical protein